MGFNMSSGPIDSKSFSHVPSPIPPIGNKSLPPIKVEEIQAAQLEAKQLLSGPPAFHHDKETVHNFALLNSGSAITGTEWEGGQPSEAFDYWGQLLRLPHMPISHGLSASQLAKAQEANTSLAYFNEKMILSANPAEILKEIVQRCDQSGSCYIPSGWTHIDGGHYCTLKVRKLENGKLAFSFLNYGAGIQYHSKLGYGRNKTKIDYQSAEYEIDPNSENSVRLIRQLILLRRQDPNKEAAPLPGAKITPPSNLETVRPYEAEDLYALLMLYGKQINASKRDPETHAVTPQRAGTCPMTNTRATTRDVLLDSGDVTPQTLKRMQFSLKLASIVEAFKAARLFKNSTLRTGDMFLANALQELNVRCYKLYPEILSSKELALAQALSSEIDAYIKTKKEATIQEVCKPHEIPPTTTPMVEKATPPEPDAAPPMNAPHVALGLEDKPELILDIKKVLPQEVMRYLADALSYFEKKSRLPETNKTQLLMELRHFMYSLPVTTGEKYDPYWDQVPKNEIGPIFAQLNTLISTHAISPGDFCQIYQCEIGLMGYDICAQLAQRVDELKLGDTFAFALDDIYSDQFFYQDADSYQCVRKINENFKKRSLNKGRVFGHIIDKRLHQEQTETYVIKHLLTVKGKQEWCKVKKGDYFPKDYNDAQLFRDMLTESGVEPPYLPVSLKDITSLSCLVHRFGRPGGNLYQPGEFIYDSNSDSFVDPLVILNDHDQDLASNQYKMGIAKKNFNMRMGREDFVLKAHVIGHSGTAENTAFHPFADLQKQRTIRREEQIHFDVIGSRREDYAQLVNPPVSRFFFGKTPPKKTVPESVDEDFRVIETTPELQVQKALEWTQYHLAELSDPLVQKRLFAFLFEYGKIEQALHESSEDLFHLIEVFQKETLKYTLDNPVHFETFLELTRLSDYLKSHIVTAASYDPSIDLSKLKMIDTRALLYKKLTEQKNPEQKVKLARNIIHSYLSQTELTKEDALLLLTVRGIDALKPSTEYSPLEYTNAKILLSHNENIQHLLQTIHEAEFNEFANRTLELSVGLKQDWKWHHQGSHLLDENGIFSINLRNGVVKKSNHSFVDIFSKLKEDQKFINSGASVACKFMSIEEGLIGAFKAKSPDDSWEINGKHKGLSLEIQTIKHQMVVDGKKKWYQFNFGTLKIMNLILDASLSLPEDLNIWESDSGEILVICPGAKDSSYRYSKEKGWEEVRKQADGNLISTGIRYLNLTQPSTDFEKQWKIFCDQYDMKPKYNHANRGGLIAATHREGQLVITKIKFWRLKLSFTPKSIPGKPDLLECVEHEGFALSSRLSIPQLCGISGAFILENKKGKQKVILPAYPLKVAGKSRAFEQQTLVERDNDFLHGSQVPYFTYHLDKTGDLVGDSPAADLYLALLYRGQHEYQLARKSLDRSYKHSNNTQQEWEIASQIKRQKDLSPEGIAFDCLLLARMLKHEKKWSASTADWKGKRELINLGEEKYRFYKKTLSEFKEGVAIIPLYLRLTHQQELLFTHGNAQLLEVQTLHLQSYRLLDEVDPGDAYSYLRWQYLDRTEFGKSNNARQGIPREALVRHLHNPSNKPAEEYLKKYFINLYEEAISGDETLRQKCRADLFYALQSEKEVNLIVYFLCKTLLFVLNQPSYFQDLKEFQSPKNCLELVSKRCLDVEDDLNLNKKIPKYDFLDPIVSDAEYAGLPYRTSSHLERTEPLAFSLKPLSAETAILQEQPLNILYSTYYSHAVQKVAAEPFALNAEGLRDATKLDVHLLERYAEGHRLNQGKNKDVFTFKKDQSLDELRAKLKTQKSEDEKGVKRLKEEALQLARAMPNVFSPAVGEEMARSLLLQTAQQGGQKEVIQWGDLVLSLLKGRPQLLGNKNIFLNQDQLDGVYAKVMECCLLQSRVSQVDEALDVLAESHDLTPYSEQRLGSILQKQRTYNILEHPEFLVYEYATGKMLQPGQVETLKWAIHEIENKQSDKQEFQHLLLQFAAGGGKTAVLIPILAQRFASKGLLPVIVNTNELYHVGLQEIPESLRASFQQQMEVLEVDLEHKWSTEEFNRLYRDLLSWKLDEKVLLIKAVTWHAINCAKKIAYAEGHPEIGQKAQQVLDFIKAYGIKLEDEGHLISNPLQQSIRTYGMRQKIPLPQQKLFIGFYDILMGRVPGMEQIAKAAGMIDYSRKEVTAQELEVIQKALAAEISKNPEFMSLNGDQLKTYLLQASKKRPEWLLQLYAQNPELGNLVISARAFICFHLPHICKLQCTKDYGTSIHPGDLTAAPKHKGQPTTAHFGDPLLTTALTIQLAEQQGVPPKQLKELLRSLQSEHQTQRKWSRGKTPAELTFQALLPPGHLPVNLETASLDDLSNNVFMQKNPLLIQRYLLEYALPQIEIPLKRVVSTPSDMQEGFDRGLTLTATPGLIETYPVTMTKENARLETPFEAEVIDTLLKPKNKEATLLRNPESAKEFFKELAAHPAFNKLDAVIDSGAILCHESPLNVIHSYLEQIKGKREGQSAVCFEGGDLVVESDNQKLQGMRINSSQLVQELIKKGLKHEEIALFLFLDLSKTTGADVKQKYSACAGLTIGKNQTVTTTIQAAMRERQLLWDNAQTVQWMMLEALYKEINPDKEFDPKALFYWMIRNESEELKTKLVSRAHQGISRVLIQHVWKAIDEGQLNYSDYAEKLEETTAFNPFNMYELESEEKDTAGVLTAFANDLCKTLKIDQSTLSDDEQKKIKQIIEQTSSLVEKMPSPRSAELNALVCQEQQAEQAQQQQQQQQVQVQTMYDGTANFRFQEENYYQGAHAINADFLSDPKPGDPIDADRPVLYTFDKTQARLPALLTHRSYLSPITSGSSTKYTKPISNILVKYLPDGTYRFLACTAAGANFYRSELQRFKERGDEVPGKFALIGFDNHILCSSGNMTSEEKRILENAKQVQQMTTYTAFLNGQIKDPYILRDIVKEYGWTQEVYQQLATAITERHVSRHPVRLINQTYFEMLCGWRKIDVASSVLMEKSAAQAKEGEEQAGGRLEGELPIQKVVPRPMAQRNPPESFLQQNQPSYLQGFLNKLSSFAPSFLCRNPKDK